MSVQNDIFGLLLNCNEGFSKRIAKNTVKAIEKVADTQLAHLLLGQDRSTASTHSLVHSLRTSHSLTIKDAVAELSSEVHAVLHHS